MITESKDPIDFIIDDYNILIMAARRCAYDLGHAANEIDRPTIDYSQRHKIWLKLFEHDGIKNYRNEMLKEIFDLKIEVKHLKELLKKHGIEDNPI